MKKYILIFGIIFHVIQNKAQTVTDFDGNIYKTIQIGRQVWIAENLKSIHYSNGTELENGFGMGELSDNTCSKYYFAYNDSNEYVNTYGRLYTWAAAINEDNCTTFYTNKIQGVCPTGFYLPSDTDWIELEKNLGMADSFLLKTGYRGTNEGGKLKDTGYSHWNAPNTGATNQSGFTGVGAGYRNFFDRGFGFFGGRNKYSYFWTTSKNVVRSIYYDDSQIYRGPDPASMGFSVRCVKDSLVNNVQNLKDGIDKINIFPNPASDKIILTYNKKQNLIFLIYNFVGDIIIQGYLYNDRNEIDISKLPKGIYIIKISNDHESVQKKIVID